MKRAILILFVLVFFVTPVSALESEPVDESLIKVSAERMEANGLSHTVIFSGKVIARQSGMVMHSEKMTLFYHADRPAEIDRIEIEGGLRIVQGDRIASADRGVFRNQEGQVFLYGNAEVHQDGNRIAGDEVVYYLNESRSVIKSQPDSRVNAVFNPGGGK